MDTKKEDKYAKGGNSMAILTAKCDRPFVVSAEKAVEFKNKKRSADAINRTYEFATKFKDNPNTKIEVGRLND